MKTFNLFWLKCLGTCQKNPLTDLMRHTHILRYLTANADLTAKIFVQKAYNYRATIKENHI